MPDNLRALQPVLAVAVLVGTTAAAQEPLPPEKATWVHAPYEIGECVLCHEREDPADPGAVPAAINDLCLECHEDIGSMMAEASTVHFPAEDACTNCHNPHNSSQEKGLLTAAFDLCVECHDDVGTLATDAPVRHDALTEGESCLACHDPHATQVEKLLLQVPGELCLSCHGEDGLTDGDGKTLVNMASLIEGNPHQHEPVAAGDCSACHEPHGSENFRLLLLEYPAKFYAPFEPANYELCFTCHDDRMVTEAETTTLTEFRNGSTNLHHRHVNKASRGRTCRACHEVHAAENVRIIRDGVPYGSKGWILPIHFEPRPDGGQCSKTCHATRAYDRVTPVEGTE